MFLHKDYQNRKQEFYNLRAFDPPLCVQNGASLCFCDNSQAIIALFDRGMSYPDPERKEN